MTSSAAATTGNGVSGPINLTHLYEENEEKETCAVIFLSGVPRKRKKEKKKEQQLRGHLLQQRRVTLMAPLGAFSIPHKTFLI